MPQGIVCADLLSQYDWFPTLLDYLGLPIPGTRLTDEYVRQIGRLAYVFAWPMVNIYNRLLAYERLPEPFESRWGSTIMHSWLAASWRSSQPAWL